MPTSRSRRLLTCSALAAAAAVLAATVAPAFTVRAAPKNITPAGVGAVKLGATFTQLRAAKLVGGLRPGCPLAGPNTRSASLLAPLRGGVDFTRTSPRKVTNIVVSRGATARGVGIGATAAKLKLAFPKAVADHSTERVFGITLWKVPKGGGGKLELTVDTATKRVTSIGIPSIAFCE